jgi:hypothetical protein
MSLFLVTASLTEPIEQPPVDAGGGAADYSRVALLGVTSDNMPFASQTLWPAGGRLDAATRMVVGDATVANMTIPLAFEDSRPVDCSGFASALACAQALCPSGGVSYSAPPTVASCDRYFILSSVCLVYDPVRGVVDGGCASYAGAAPGALPPASVVPLDAFQLSPFYYDVYAAAPRGPFPVRGMPWALRSAQDPWVVGLRLTGGTGILLQGNADAQMERAPSRAAQATALFIVAGLLAFVPAVLLVAAMRRRHHWEKAERQRQLAAAATLVATVFAGGGGGGYIDASAASDDVSIARQSPLAVLLAAGAAKATAGPLSAAAAGAAESKVSRPWL